MFAQFASSAFTAASKISAPPRGRCQQAHGHLAWIKRELACPTSLTLLTVKLLLFIAHILFWAINYSFVPLQPHSTLTFHPLSLSLSLFPHSHLHH